MLAYVGARSFIPFYGLKTGLITRPFSTSSAAGPLRHVKAGSARKGFRRFISNHGAFADILRFPAYTT